MKKQLNEVRRMQQLAGIKPLYEAYAGPKSKLEKIIQQAWGESDINAAKKLVIDFISPSKIKSKDQIINTIKGLTNKREFDRYMANALLKFEKLGLNESIDVTYDPEEGVGVDNYKAMDFMKQTLKNKGYNIPEEVWDDMYEEAHSGDLFGIYDPKNPYTKMYTDWPTIDYYKTFNEDKAVEMVNDYVNMMIEDGGLDVESIEDFKQ